MLREGLEPSILADFKFAASTGSATEASSPL